MPIWVKATSETGSGNPHLVELGANWLPSRLESIASLTNIPALTSVEGEQDGGEDAHLDAHFADSGKEGSGETSREIDQSESNKTAETSVEAAADRYEIFIKALAGMQNLLPCNAKAISSNLGMRQADVTRFLKKGVDQGAVEKLSKPVRFRLVSSQPKQTSFL